MMKTIRFFALFLAVLCSAPFTLSVVAQRPSKHRPPKVSKASVKEGDKLLIQKHRKHAKLNPNDSKAHLLLAEALMWQGDWKGDREEANKEFREAIRLDPNNACAHYGLGVCYAFKDQPETALRELREAVRLNPKHDLSVVALANMLVRKGEYVEAIKMYHQALRLKPQNAQYRISLGVALYKNGQKWDAEGEWLNVVADRKADKEFKRRAKVLLEAVGLLGEVETRP